MKYTGKRIAILGAGKSGIGAALTAAKAGAHVLLSDAGHPHIDDEINRALRQAGAECAFGMQSIDIFSDADRIIVSPGIPTDSPVLAEAKRLGIDIVGEIELAYDMADAPILGVTGTNGKTTTTALLAAVLKEAGKRIVVGGNIGDALSAEIMKAGACDYIIAELSSYQLETIESFRTAGAIVLNLTPDHLERHKTMEAYATAKEGIFRNQTPEGITVLNIDDPIVAEMEQRVPGKCLHISMRHPVADGAYTDEENCFAVCGGEVVPVLKTSEVPLAGAHNVENILAVIALTYAIGIAPDAIRSGIVGFKAVPHRLEFVRETGGVCYYNDSKATNTDAAVKALQAFDVPIHLIVGGYDKMTDLTALMQEAAADVVCLYLIGAASERFANAAEVAEIPYRFCGDMKAAVEAAGRAAVSGDVVLLAPACASYDQYTCFEERGDDFKRLVNAL